MSSPLGLSTASLSTRQIGELESMPTRSYSWMHSSGWASR
jgi:hypothetical protein